MRLTSLIFFFALLAKIDAATMEEARPVRGHAAARVNWFDETGRQRNLSDFAGHPVILLPMYSHCQSTCPINIASLKNAIATVKADLKEFRVLLFSFDANETPRALADLRQREALPLSWSLGSASRDEIDRLMESIGFQFGESGDQFLHPNILLFLDRNLAVADWIYGSNYSASQVERGLRVAAGENDWLGRHVIALYTFAILAVSLLAIALVHFGLERRRLQLAAV